MPAHYRTTIDAPLPSSFIIKLNDFASRLNSVLAVRPFTSTVPFAGAQP